MRPCVPVAAVVGCVLSAINEGTQIAAGRAGWAAWVRVGLNFVVPFLVASYGYLSAARVPPGAPGSRLGTRRLIMRRDPGAGTAWAGCSPKCQPR